VLWRYDAAKFVDRIGADWQPTSAVLVVHDAGGVLVDVGPLRRPTPRHVLWGRAAVYIGDVHAAAVWIGADTAPLWKSTLLVALVAGLAAGVLGLLLYLLPVRAVRGAEQRIAGLMTQLALTQREEERSRIALELHDGAGQALTAARLHLMSLERESGSAQLPCRIEPVVALLDDALAEIRRSTAALMPPAIADLGLRGAIQRHCEAFAGASGLQIDLEADPQLPDLGVHVQTTCYRIVQEALTNIARHARAQHAKVTLVRRDEALVLTVTDDGAGIDESASAEPELGVRSIQTRATLLGGSARLLPADQGTCLEITLPLDRGTA
jgi:signal transduction histidine kinase